MKRLKKVVLLTFAMLAAVTLGCTSISKNSGEKRELVVVTWGGSLEEAFKQVDVAEFEKEFNCTVIMESPSDYAKLKSMVETGHVQWDLVTVDPDFVPRGASQGLLQPIDYSIVDAANLDPHLYSEYGVGAYTWATSLGYNTDKYPGSAAPRSWADFWNVKKFPGARTMWKSAPVTLEIALLADGVVKEDLYPLDLDRAFASLDKIKDKIGIWWESGAQPQQMLASKQVDLAVAWNGRIKAAKDEGAAVDVNFYNSVLITDQWVVPAGAPRAELAMRFINFVTRADKQAEFAKIIPYGPTNTKAYERLDAAVSDVLPGSPRYAADIVLYDDGYWAENYDKVNERFQGWLLP